MRRRAAVALLTLASAAGAAGYGQSSGDGDPEDDDHDTFFQMLPTARIYAQLQLGAYLYYGHAFGQGVVKQTFAGDDADYGYVELTWRL